MKVTILGDGHLATTIFDAFTHIGHKAHLTAWPDTHPIACDSECVVLAYDVDHCLDVPTVLEKFDAFAHQVPANALVVVCSQLPVGSVHVLETWYPDLRFACSPENIKQNATYKDFLLESRVICGVRNDADKAVLVRLFSYAPIGFMSVESAEMTKHAINAYLGMCIAFVNELADICKTVGADVREVEHGLRTEPRVSAVAPLHAGQPFGLGHIDRDLEYLRHLLQTDLISAIRTSNDKRKHTDLV